jgi:hypothetical protein
VPQNKIYDKDKYKNEKAPYFKITNPKEVELKQRENRLYSIDTKRLRNAVFTQK